MTSPNRKSWSFQNVAQSVSDDFIDYFVIPLINEEKEFWSKKRELIKYINCSKDAAGLVQGMLTFHEYKSDTEVSFFFADVLTLPSKEGKRYRYPIEIVRSSEFDFFHREERKSVGEEYKIGTPPHHIGARWTNNRRVNILSRARERYHERQNKKRKRAESEEWGIKGKRGKFIVKTKWSSMSV